MIAMAATTAANAENSVAERRVTACSFGKRSEQKRGHAREDPAVVHRPHEGVAREQVAGVGPVRAPAVADPPKTDAAGELHAGDDHRASPDDVARGRGVEAGAL